MNLGAGTFWVDYANLDSLKLWFNHLPKREKATCHLSPIKVLPHVKTKLVNPTIEVGGQTITFPTALESGSYLECRSMDDCRIYDAKGALVGGVKPQGNIPKLETGDNVVNFSCNVTNGVSARANVTIISQSEKVVGK